MALSPGSRLGPYEILAPIGAGGMGEVYRARDTRLGRDVAVKVLPERIEEDPEALARFEREARTVAGLNDPHVCSLHDVGVEHDVHYVVLELLEGETLRSRLSHGALPQAKAIELTTQICQGLAAAHAKGIVHRDLKPENLFLTRQGLKILDFGLAKLQPVGHASMPSEDLSRVPTVSAPEALTTPGTAPGTVAYMSPEQVRGTPADARSDIFATGLTLCEMLSGQRPFRRDTQPETLAAILNDDLPELVAPSGNVAPGLERIVRRCLEKDPEDRFQSARDVTFALEAVSGTSGVSDLSAEARRGARDARRKMVTPLVAVAVIALVAGALGGRWWARPPESAREAPTVRSEIDLTADLPLIGFRNHPSRTELAVSPDGTLLVWAGGPDGDAAQSALHVRRLGTGEVTHLAGTEGATQPFFSPDGCWIGFSVREGRSSRLRKVPVEGGLAVDLAELLQSPMGVSWEPNGRILLGSWDGGVRWVPAEGGSPREITSADRAREAGHRLPSVLPGGQALVFTTIPNVLGVTARIEALSLVSGERRVVVEDGADGRYLPSGHLVFVRRGVLMAAPFDLDRLELTAPPVPAVAGVSQALNFGSDGGNSGAAQFAVSDSGLLVYASGGILEDMPVELLLLDESGRATPLPGFDKPHVSAQVRFSPDGRQLAFVEQSGSGLLWLFDVERHTFRALSDRGLAANPRWSSDGARLVVGWAEAGPYHLWVVPPGGGGWERLTDGERHHWAPTWSPDGRVLAFVGGRPPSNDILLYRFEDRQVVPFLTTQAREEYPEFSPDGRWLAYASDESGRLEIHVTSFPDRDQTLTVSRQGGEAPAWSRDGRRLFYYSLPSPDDGTRSMMAVPVRHGPQLSLGIPAALFRLPDGFSTLRPMRSYELHPDGRRFVIGRVVKRDPSPPITRLHLVHNWFAELERLAPTDR